MKKLDREILKKLIQRRAAGEYLDLADWDLSNGDFSGIAFNQVLFSPQGQRKLEGVNFSNSQFTDCRFGYCDIQDCLFTRARFEHADLRKSNICGCDFRYSFFDESTLAETKIKLCDFYRTIFRRNVIFERARLIYCSLHRTVLDGSDIDWAAIGKVGVVQAHPTVYKEFLKIVAKRDKKQVLDDKKIDHYVAIGHLEAAAIYRKISAIFGARGQYSDSSNAYVRARQLERYGLWPSVNRLALEAECALNGLETSESRGTLRTILLGIPVYLELWAADLICRFGTSVSRVLLTMLTVIFIFATLYCALGAISTSYGTAGFTDSLAFSLGKTIADVPDGFKISNLARPLAEFQVFISLALIGLFGFVLGNYFRQS